MDEFGWLDMLNLHYLQIDTAADRQDEIDQHHSTPVTYYTTDEEAADAVHFVLVNYLLVKKQEDAGILGAFWSEEQEDLYYQLRDEAEDEAAEQMLRLLVDGGAFKAFLIDLFGEYSVQKIFARGSVPIIGDLQKQVAVSTEATEMGYKEIPAAALVGAIVEMMRELEQRDQRLIYD